MPTLKDQITALLQRTMMGLYLAEVQTILVVDNGYLVTYSNTRNGKHDHQRAAFIRGTAGALCKANDLILG